MPVPEAGQAARRSDAGRPVPVDARMPVRLEIHDVRPALRRMAAEVGEHVRDDLERRIAGTRGGQAASRHRRGRAEKLSELRRHWPGAGLHHEFRDVPDHLHFGDASALKSEILVVAHMGEMAGRRNAQEGTRERAHVVAHCADPVLAFRSGAGNQDHVATLKIGHGMVQRSEAGGVEGIRPDLVAKRVTETQQGLVVEGRCKRSLDRARRECRAGRPVAGDAGPDVRRCTHYPAAAP